MAGRLPKGETRRNLWITNSHRADSWDPQTDFVYFCSKHFTPESFELTGCSGIRRLREDAFPTVFDSSSTTKCKRPKTLLKQEDVPVSLGWLVDFQNKTPCANFQALKQPKGKQFNCLVNLEAHKDKKKMTRSEQMNKLWQEGFPLRRAGAQPTRDRQGSTSKEPTAQKSVAAAEENHENIPASSQEPSGVEQLSQQERGPSPPPASRPPSPSRYMRRLPPPPGFYLSKEHSYAQLSPLLWRRRYDQAIDCLEKALRQLHAARRRENRLRSTVLRLRDKRLKQALLVPRDGCKRRGSWTPEVEKRLGKDGDNQEESETDTKSEETDVFRDRCVDQMELLPDTNSWSEEEKGYCFYCGRGQAQAGSQVVRRASKTKEYARQDSLTIETSVETSTCGTAKEKRIVRLKRPPGKRVEADPDVTKSQNPASNSKSSTRNPSCSVSD
ncbi:THAP domain-containing protein 7 [Nibea albiflora]|uniref:THAP domain-containing protein 7 n=1 Tax=Nibea albiflora TaxID=240163 RepID=A0ACB7ES49_NIBAL|nr:THAP domain-containing protein 7 [Nibea albiflora]